MSVEFVLLAAMFVAVPVTVKYATAFEVRGLLDGLKRREREIDRLDAWLDGLEEEREVVERAVLQIYEQRRWSQTRRDLMAEELERARRRAGRRRRRPTDMEDEPFEIETPPRWEAEADPAAAPEEAPQAASEAVAAG